MFNYEIRVFPLKAADGSIYWTARFPAVDGCVGGGDTPAEAIAEANDNLKVLLDYLAEEKKKIPDEYDPPEYNGKIALRIQKSTHKIIAEMAEQEGVSINSLLSNAIEYYLGIRQYEYRLDQKIDRIKALAGFGCISQFSTESMVRDLWEGLDDAQKKPPLYFVNAGGYDEEN